jgi:iron complex outermembrane recepter protein
LTLRRGHFEAANVPGQFLWHVGAYHTDSDSDILLLGTAINGFGFFDNVGTTRRQGIEASLAWHWDRWQVSANYSYLNATFLENLALSSNSPAADANGLIFVHPGDQIPMMPSNRLVLNAEYSVTPHWKLGADLRFVSSQYLVGDESNQEPKLPAYVTLDLHTSYRIVDRVMLFVELDNLNNARYYTYGTFTQLDGLPPNFNLTDSRTFTPAPGRSVFGGIRVSF